MNSNNGNVMFLILIAVALFAALSYAITISSRSGGVGIAKEKGDLATAVLEQCEGDVNAAKLRLKTINNCTDEHLSFELPDGRNSNPDAPASKRCHIFYPQGGGVAPCGGYTETAGPATGVITAGETTAIARVGASSTYFRCNSWSGNMCMTYAFTTEGTTFKNQDLLCIEKSGDGRSVGSFMNQLHNAICAGACSGTKTGSLYYTGPNPGPNHVYINDDYSITPLPSGCDKVLDIELGCSCF